MRNEEHIVRLDTSTLYFISHANVVGSEVALCQQQRGQKNCMIKLEIGSTL